MKFEIGKGISGGLSLAGAGLMGVFPEYKPLCWLVVVAGISIFFFDVSLSKSGAAGTAGGKAHAKPVLSFRNTTESIATAILLGAIVIGLAIGYGLPTYNQFASEQAAPRFYLPPGSDWHGRDFAMFPIARWRTDLPRLTSEQRDSLLQPFIGRWFAVKATLWDVSDVPITHGSLASTPFSPGRGMVSMFFDPAAGAPLKMFNRGDEFAAYCQLKSVSEIQVLGDHCQLAQPPP